VGCPVGNAHNGQCPMSMPTWKKSPVISGSNVQYSPSFSVKSRFLRVIITKSLTAVFHRINVGLLQRTEKNKNTRQRHFLELAFSYRSEKGLSRKDAV